MRYVKYLITVTAAMMSLTGCGDGGGGDTAPSSGGNSGTATLTWEAPTTEADGTTPLSDLAGYKVYYGTTSGSYPQTIDVGNVTTYEVSNLIPGTYYFAVRAYDTSSNESVYSNEASKTIQ